MDAEEARLERAELRRRAVERSLAAAEQALARALEALSAVSRGENIADAAGQLSELRAAADGLDADFRAKREQLEKLKREFESELSRLEKPAP